MTNTAERESRERFEKWFDAHYYTGDPVAKRTAYAAYSQGFADAVEAAAQAAQGIGATDDTLRTKLRIVQAIRSLLPAGKEE